MRTLVCTCWRVFQSRGRGDFLGHASEPISIWKLPAFFFSSPPSPRSLGLHRKPSCGYVVLFEWQYLQSHLCCSSSALQEPPFTAAPKDLLWKRKDKQNKKRIFERKIRVNKKEENFTFLQEPNREYMLSE